eukprot:6193573-Pleurochrysis_carterae.AAC.2
MSTRTRLTSAARAHWRRRRYAKVIADKEIRTCARLHAHARARTHAGASRLFRCTPARATRSCTHPTWGADGRAQARVQMCRCTRKRTNHASVLYSFRPRLNLDLASPSHPSLALFPRFSDPFRFPPALIQCTMHAIAHSQLILLYARTQTHTHTDAVQARAPPQARKPDIALRQA